MSASVYDRVVALLKQVAGPDVDVNKTGLAFKSIQMLEFILAVENEFGVKMPEDAPLMEITQSADHVVAFLADQGI